jgi:hypothetical protein
MLSENFVAGPANLAASGDFGSFLVKAIGCAYSSDGLQSSAAT